MMDNSRLLALLHFLPFPAAICEDAECGKITINKAMADMMATFYTGTTPNGASFLSSPFYKVYHDGLELTEQELPLRQAILEGKEIMDFELTLVRPNGSVGTMLAYAMPWREDGRTLGGIALYLDTTNLSRARAEIKVLRNQLKELAATNR